MSGRREAYVYFSQLIYVFLHKPCYHAIKTDVISKPLINYIGVYTIISLKIFV